MPGNWVQIVAEIHSDRTDRCCIAKAQTDGVAILIGEIFETDGIENISAVIEGRER